MSTRIQTRRDVAADWTSNNPTLLAGEMGWESDTGLFKIGDGTTAWTSLGYHNVKRRVWVPAAPTVAYTGSPAESTASTSNRVGGLLLDAGTNEGTYGWVFPNVDDFLGWSTCDIYLWFYQAGTGTGNVVVNGGLRGHADDGDTGAGTSFGPAGNATLAVSGTQYQMQRESMGSAVTVPADLNGGAPPASLWVPNFYRAGADGSDTYAGDIGAVAIEFVKVS